MRLLSGLLFIFMLVSFLAYPVNAEDQSESVEKREAALNDLIKNCAAERSMRPEATIQLQNGAASSLAQPTVSTLAQPNNPVSMASVLDIIKNTATVIKPKE